MEKVTYQEASKSWTTGVITEQIEDTFGPNPCTTLKLLNDETGDLLELPCDSKRCQDCSPRKQLTMTLQLQTTFGEYTYVLRVTNPDKIIARMKKQNDREDLGWMYQSVGDDYLGYIIISNLPIIENQNRTSLKDWLQRVIHNWLYGDKRLRRTRKIGRLSLFAYRRKCNKGQSAWARFVEFVRDDTPWREPLTEDEKLHIWQEKRVIENAAMRLQVERNLRQEAERANL